MQLIGRVIEQDLGQIVGRVIEQDLGTVVGRILLPIQDRDPEDLVLAEMDALAADPATRDKVLVAVVNANPEGGKPHAAEAAE